MASSNGGLVFWWCAIDFVEQYRCEHRTRQEDEFARAGGLILANDFRAGDIRRHQIGSELNAVEAEFQG
jgi:hypothetical protein